MEQGSNVICEKPLVLDPGQLHGLEELEQKTGKRVFTVLQLRLLEPVIALKEAVQRGEKKMFKVIADYVSPRGGGYFASWKGKPEFSGGLVTNLGIHLFDLLIWIFGPVQSLQLIEYTEQRVKGELKLESADVDWRISVTREDLPSGFEQSYRSIRIGEEELRLDRHTGPLHTRYYQEVLAGRGCGIAASGPSLLLCHQIRELGKKGI